MHKAFPEGTCSYTDFIAIVSDILKSKGADKGSHLIDRVVETYVVRATCNGTASDERYVDRRGTVERRRVNILTNPYLRAFCLLHSI